MTKILLVLTGGTIGSEKKKNIINITKNNYLKNFLEINFKKKIDFKIINPVNILSENSLPSDWNNITASINKNWENDFSGIIITYGTDTLAFAASAFAQFFCTFNKPVILVSSNKPIKEKNSSGRDNLLSAVKFIDNKKQRGVYVAYKNPRENFVSFLLGSRVQQINSYENKLISLNGGFVCKYKNNKFTYKKNKFNFSISSINKESVIYKKKLLFSKKILAITPYPGINYSNYNLKKNKISVVLHSLYHSGTASTRAAEGKEYSLINFIKKCKNKKIPFYLAPINLGNKSIYKSLESLLNLGIKSLKGVTFETAYAKLSLAYGSFKQQKDIDKFLSKNNLFERTKF